MYIYVYMHIDIVNINLYMIEVYTDVKLAAIISIHRAWYHRTRGWASSRANSIVTTLHMETPSSSTEEHLAGYKLSLALYNVMTVVFVLML